MVLIIYLFNFLILFFLSTIHFYWALGGVWGFEASLPTNQEGKRMLNPKKIDCIIVAGGLLLFAIYLLISAGLISFHLPNWIFIHGIWVIIGIFLLRAIGDFKYIGFFKKIKKTDFAIRDNRYYSPLCLWLSLSSLMIFYLT